MPPRLPTLAAFGRAVPTTSSPLIISYFLPLLQSRSASILATLSDNPGAYNKRIRRGRGPSSGKGKTSGRGHKGQKQHGKVPARFQGGQTPQEIVHGTRGFENQYAFSLCCAEIVNRKESGTIDLLLMQFLCRHVACQS
jgi:large subunit ribosomal protein L15